ncbi:tetratricopeptide repeat protein [Rhodopirellula sallentina]|uniref:TPR repeat-containing protein n=1 Tax=Rhodopirellula sallentina SM41 TaxID=1263870 RepID=M5ULN5_9BACT|nr:hypothetical protein [Rhodopirellula sallentina]EMI56933.1 hypothetical protein RSSM_01614 [Rhodopirellula sallentina SM41]
MPQDEDYWLWLANQPASYLLDQSLTHSTHNLDLIVHFLFSRKTHPKLFRGDQEAETSLSPETRAETESACVKALKEIKNSRAKLLLANYYQTLNKQDLAIGVLASFTEHATNNLVRSGIDSANQADTKPLNAPLQTSLPRPSAHWDFLLLYEYARQTKHDSPTEALKHFQFLASLDSNAVPKQQIEHLYLETGMVSLEQGRHEEAVQTWKEGLTKLADESVVLPRAIAASYVNQGKYKEAENTARTLQQAIQTATTKINRASQSEMAQSERVAANRRLDLAQWHLDVLLGTISAEQGDELVAIEKFQRVVDSDTEAETAERVQVCIRLAELYGSQGMWDASAIALEKAIALAPNNEQLRIAASNAWNQSGNSLKAMRHWDFVNTSTSLSNRIARIEARFNFQFRLLPEQRNFDDIRTDVRQLKKELQIASEAVSGTSLLPNADNSPLSFEQGALNKQETGDDEESLRSRLLYVEAFEMTLPQDGTSGEDHLTSTRLAEKIDELSKKHPGEATLQAFAAERLAHAGMSEPALEALTRLENADDSNSVFIPIVRARTLAGLGLHEDAANYLIDIANSRDPLGRNAPPDEVADLRESKANLLQTAASFASRAGDLELAYEALSSISPEHQTVSTLTAVTRIAARLPVESASLHLNNEKVSAQELSQHWLDLLRNREGDEGTHWRYLKALGLLESLQSAGRDIDTAKPELSQAHDLVTSILARRPRWGNALALEGWISALKGKPHQAVDQLRRGIDAGCSQMHIRRLLWQQLILLGRTDEAEQEIQLAELESAHRPSDLIATKINLALRQGDYSKSMQVAMDAAAENPDDPVTHLVVAATGTTALQKTPPAEDREKFLDQTYKAIEAASKLVGNSDIRVLSARLRLHIALSDEQAIKRLAQEIQASNVPDPSQSQLLAQALTAINDLDGALKMLIRADQLAPTSESQLKLARIYRLLDQPEQEIEALRISLQRNPNSSTVRNTLAQKLVAQSGRAGEVNWSEISELLSKNDAAGSRNRLMHAILLAGDALRHLAESETGGTDSWPNDSKHVEQLSQAEEILQQLVTGHETDTDMAQRALASLLQKGARYRAGITDNERLQRASRIRTLYENLTNRAEPLAGDLYQYATYLLNLDDEHDNSKIQQLLEQMNLVAGNKLETLEVALRFSGRQGNRNEMPAIVGHWANTAISQVSPHGNRAEDEQASLKQFAILAAAGSSLQKLGFSEESVEWFERAYKEHPGALGPYVIALGKNGETEEAIEVCAHHFDQHRDAQSAKLLVELLLSIQEESRLAELVGVHKERLSDSVDQFAKDALLLEGVGTLQMAQGNNQSAIKTFSQVLKVKPTSIRALNNLAMAYSEIPELASQGLAPIETALNLTNQNPELLDTKGVVLMASNRLAEAEAIFEEAFTATNEPRHQFHVVLARLAQGKKELGQKAWKRLDLKRLDPTALTPTERKRLETLKKQFGGQL